MVSGECGTLPWGEAMTKQMISLWHKLKLSWAQIGECFFLAPERPQAFWWGAGTWQQPSQHLGHCHPSPLPSPIGTTAGPMFSAGPLPCFLPKSVCQDPRKGTGPGLGECDLIPLLTPPGMPAVPCASLC